MRVSNERRYGRTRPNQSQLAATRVLFRPATPTISSGRNGREKAKEASNITPERMLVLIIATSEIYDGRHLIREGAFKEGWRRGDGATRRSRSPQKAAAAASPGALRARRQITRPGTLSRNGRERIRMLLVARVFTARLSGQISGSRRRRSAEKNNNHLVDLVTYN